MKNLKKNLDILVRKKWFLETIKKEIEKTTQEMLGPIAKDAATTADPNKIEQQLKNMNDAYNQQMGEWNQEEQKEEVGSQKRWKTSKKT